MRKMRLERIAAVCVLATMMLFASITPVSAAEPTFTFSGDGYGHGIGLSQLGAVGMAKAGWNRDQIVTHYYKGTAVSSKPFSNRALVYLDSEKASRTSWTIRPGYHGGTLFIDSGGVRTPYPDDFYTFTSTSTGIRMTSKSGKTATRVFPGSINVVADTRMSVALNQIVDPSGPFNRSDMRYRGYFILTPQSTKVRLLNSVNIDQYLYGVVPRELGDFYSPLPAASQAQAIVARSYAYPKITAGTALACSTSDQVYGGHSRFSSEANRIANAASRYEETNANNAVKATADKVVTYGGKVIATYFSACNGEYTARNSEVWGSTQLPYYESVKDGYCNHSDHAWTKTYDATTLAVQIARKTTAPAGAGTSVFVENLTPIYGTNGWVKALTVTWSNKATTQITRADNVRIYLGLRSARFTVAKAGGQPVTPPVVDPPTPPVTPPVVDPPVTPPVTPPVKPTPPPVNPTPAPVSLNRYEEGNSIIRRVGTWKVHKIKGNSGSKIRTANKLNAYFEIKFKGSEVTWVGPKSPSYGRAKVYVDGVYKGIVNVQAKKIYRQQSLYRIKGLDPTKQHTLKVVVTTKAGSKKVGLVGLDRIDVRGGAAVALGSKTYDSTTALLRRSAGWSTLRDPGHYATRAAFTRKISKTLTTKFTGNAIAVYGQKSYRGGRAKVYLDGSYKTTVSFKSVNLQQGTPIYSISGLNTDIIKTLKFVSIAKPGSRSPGHVVIDRVVVTGGELR